MRKITQENQPGTRTPINFSPKQINEIIVNFASFKTRKNFTKQFSTV